MSSFYLRARFFSADSSFSSSYSSVFSDNQFLIVSSENFNSSNFISGIAKKYYQGINVGNNSDYFFLDSLGLANNGAAFDASNLYLLSQYKSGQVKCIPALGGTAGLSGSDNQGINSGINNVELKNGTFLAPRLYTVGADNYTVYETDIYVYNAIVVNKAYHKMLPSGDGSSSSMLSLNITDAEINKIPTNNIYINYSVCKILNFKINASNAQNQFYYKNLILIEDKNLDYLENFDDSFYYDPATQRYYLDILLTECSIKVYEDVFPYLLIVSSDSWDSRSVFHGPVKLQLEKINDANLEDVSDLISFQYADVCNATTTIAANNTITCTSNPGEVSVNVNGVVKVFNDQQICPIDGTAKTVIGVFSLKPNGILTLYKDFSAVNTVKADIWGYNFRYIKYFDGTNYHSFKDNGSVASATVSYIEQILDLSKYFSIKEISDGTVLSDSGKITAITLRFKIYKIAETDADATDYFIDVPVEILSPAISMTEDSAAKKIKIKTNFATKLIYRFNEEQSVLVNITDTADGTEQETIVDSTGKTGSFYCKAFNYYYDLGGAKRNLYITEEISIDLIRNISIPTFDLAVKIGASTKTIYDENGNSSSSLSFTDLIPSQIGNYFVYSNYKTETGNYTFQLNYDLTNTQYSSMYLRIGENSALYPLLLSGGYSSYSLSKQDLFEMLDSNDQVKLYFLADGKTPFVFTFSFLNVSPSDPPVCDAFGLSRVQLNYPKAAISFSLSYTYGDEIEYSVVDQDINNILYGPILIKERFRDIESYFINGTTRQRDIRINQVSINENTSLLRVVAKVRNIQSATNNTPKIEDVEISSPSYYIPAKIGSVEIILYSDSNLTVGTEIDEIKKGEDFWAFLQIKDVDGAIVPVANYPSYLAVGYKPEIFMLESDDANKDLDGVIYERVNDYVFKFNIKNDSVFNDTNAVFRASYQPIID